MVHQSPKRSSLIIEKKSAPHQTRKYKYARKSTHKDKIALTIFIATFLITFGVFKILSISSSNKATENIETENTIAETETKIEEKPKIPDFINLESTIENWASSLPRGVNIGLEIYDLDNEKIAAKRNSNKVFQTASLYKMFIVYEGYREIESGDISENSIIVNDKNVSECLDLSIRESDSPCAETLWAKIGRNKIENIIKDNYELENSSASGFYSTADDMIKLLKIYYYHKDLSESSFEKIKDSLLNQPPIRSSTCGEYCDFRIGLPSGFSDSAKVYNKVGFESDGVGKWNVYNDSAIIEFPELGRTYLISVFTENLPYSNKKISVLANLASDIETTIYSNSPDNPSNILDSSE